VLIPPMGDAAACPAFVAGRFGGPVKLVVWYPPPVFAGKPAATGFVEVGAEVAVPVLGKSGFEPELLGLAPGTAILLPVGLYCDPPMLSCVKRGFATVAIAQYLCTLGVI